MRRQSVWIALGVVTALHVALTLRFEPPAVVFGPDPITTLDYGTHYQQNWRAAQAFEESGRFWSYNPHLLAGQVSGAIFDADNKLYEVFTVTLEALGVPLHTAHNLFVLVVHLLVFPVLFSAARLFGAAERMLRAAESPVYEVYEPNRSLYERVKDNVRLRLGEEGYEAVQAEGQEMTFEKAVAYALKHDQISCA